MPILNELTGQRAKARALLSSMREGSDRSYDEALTSLPSTVEDEILISVACILAEIHGKKQVSKKDIVNAFRFIDYAGSLHLFVFSVDNPIPSAPRHDNGAEVWSVDAEDTKDITTRLDEGADGNG